MALVCENHSGRSAGASRVGLCTDETLEYSQHLLVDPSLESREGRVVYPGAPRRASERRVGTCGLPSAPKRSFPLRKPPSGASQGVVPPNAFPPRKNSFLVEFLWSGDSGISSLIGSSLRLLSTLQNRLCPLSLMFLRMQASSPRFDSCPGVLQKGFRFKRCREANCFGCCLEPAQLLMKRSNARCCTIETSRLTLIGAGSLTVRVVSNMESD
jgi:hypothetical protein